MAYSNTEVDGLISEGNQAPSIDDGIALYNQAEDIILQDMPVIPMGSRGWTLLIEQRRHDRCLQPGEHCRGERQLLITIRQTEAAGTGLPYRLPRC